MRRAGRRDPAVERARAVVGLYGDPTITWSIMLEAELAVPLDLDRLPSALVRLFGDGRVLGRAGEVRRFAPGSLGEVRAGFANTPYGDRDPLLRVAVDDLGTTLLVAAHHGAVDGLGLVAVLNSLLDSRMHSEARGVGGVAPAQPFLRRAVQRLDEAVRRPPARFRPAGAAPGAAGDWLVSADVSGRHLSTAALVAATGRALHRWNQTAGRRPVVVAVGASRRPQAAALTTPDRDTAYLRVELPDRPTTAAVAELLARTPPEPDFPAARGWGVVPLLTRALAPRLGATALVSNLGRLSGDHPPLRLRLWPAASGPSGVAVGLVTAGGASDLTVRARRTAFDQAAAERLLELVDDELRAQ